MSMQSEAPGGAELGGRYTANILGTIRSHLEALQGFDAMALELIQNADDARAAEITFDVTDDALVVTNSGVFSFCGDLQRSSCLGVASPGGTTRSCDFHNITEVASGGKLGDPGNIGRFGIGFISTYQVTDSPGIRSGDLEVHLHPERLEWSGRRVAELTGTRFTLRWASDERSPVRTQLCLSAITEQHIGRVMEDTREVLERSLIFLRHVRKAHLLRNGSHVLSVTIERVSDADLTISFEGGGPRQEWLILRANAEAALPPIVAAHPRLAALKRRADVTIAVRVEPDRLESGLLYAYLPTQQSSGLPLHVNGDFFPTSSRKAAIFEGHQHQQAWNETLVRAAAATVAEHLERLRDSVGHVALWELIKSAEQVSKRRQPEHPDCYGAYWKELQRAFAADPPIVLAADGSSVSGRAALLSKTALSDVATAVAKKIGLTLVSERLRPFSNWLPSAGVQQLTLDRLVAACEQSVLFKNLPATTDLPNVQAFYVPLWGLLDAHVSGLKGDVAPPIVERLRKLHIGVTGEFRSCGLAQCFTLPPGIPRRDVETLLPWVSLPHPEMLKFAELASVLPQLSLAHIVSHLEREASSPEKAERLLGSNLNRLKAFYALLAWVDELARAPRELCERLAALPIWRTGSGFASLEKTRLPGDFRDPIGLSTVLATEAFDARTKEFLATRLGVKKQSVKVFVQDVLPVFFGNPDGVDLGHYQQVMIELADRATLLDDEEISRLLARLPLVPTQDGKWNKPSRTYFHTELLEEILGPLTSLWVDETRLPSRRSVRSLLISLGIRTQPAAADLVGRLIEIAESNYPTVEAREASARAFYALGDQLALWKSQSVQHELAEVEKLRTVACLPADNSAVAAR